MAKYYSEFPEWSQMTKEEFEMREKIIAVIKEHTRQVGYSTWDGHSEDGVSEDDYDEVADSIMEAFTIVPKEKVE
jgi:hypothetical protein